VRRRKHARTVYRDRKANSASYMSTLNTQDDENVLQPTRETWLRFGGKAPPFFFGGGGGAKHLAPDAAERMAPVSRPMLVPSCASPDHTTLFGSSVPRNKHQAAAHFESFRTDDLRHPLTAAFRLTAGSHGWPPRLALANLRLTKHATNLSVPDKLFAVPHDVSGWYFLSDAFCVCMYVREKTDCNPVTVCGLHVQLTT